MSRQVVEETEKRIAALSPRIEQLKAEFSRVVVGQEDFRLGLMTALFCDGHVLIEGVPGLAKTLAARTMASCLSASFSRIQFTPDLLPADLTGTMIYLPEKGTFEPRRGPVFTQILLADEINRAPAKVQSALLEAMQERQVTFGGITNRLPQPFFVMATQNPIEQEGTYPLPEAQIDRFLLKLKVDYPSQDEELLIMSRMGARTQPAAAQILSTEEVIEIQGLVSDVVVEQSILEYIVRLVAATRFPKQSGFTELAGLISFGASPRASLGLQSAARARALLEGQGFVTPEHVKDVAPDVLRHRIIRSFEAEAEEVGVEEIIETILGRVPVK